MVSPIGQVSISREPLLEIPIGCRLATAGELFCANQGKPFPWGSLPEPVRASRLWKEHRVGVGGLIHKRWFVTKDGRFGGADNVPKTIPGSLRCSMVLDGGQSQTELLNENEGYAVVQESSTESQFLFRKIQLYAAKHVVADGGAIIQSPIQADGRIFVGFVGRCQTCPNAELISFQQLKKEFVGVQFELFPEWRNWKV